MNVIAGLLVVIAGLFVVIAGLTRNLVAPGIPNQVRDDEWVRDPGSGPG